MGIDPDYVTPKLSHPSLPPSFLISKSVVFENKITTLEAL
jgi:hypothetical protein